MRGSPKRSLSFRFPHQNPVYASLLTIRASCHAYLILLDFMTWKILGEDYRSFSSSLCSFLHYLVISSLLGPNILINLFTNTLSLRSSLNVSDQVSHPNKTTGKIIVHWFKGSYRRRDNESNKLIPTTSLDSAKHNSWGSRVEGFRQTG
jgi:hypothetical protein